MTIKLAGRGPELVASYAIFAVLTTFVTGLRMYCRAVLLKKVYWDDYLALVSWLLFILLCACVFIGAAHGSGQHTAQITPPTEITIAMKWWWRCELLYVLSNMAIKASIAVILLRLTTANIHRRIIWVTIVTMEIFSLFFFFLFVFQCQPSSYFWTRYAEGKGSCLDAMVIVRSTYVYTAVICVTDWVLAILPFFLVWGLQMQPRAKLLVACILALGAIASVTTIIRIPYLASLTHTSDFLYATVDVAIWSACETGIAITAASGATLRPLFRSFLERSRQVGGSRSAFQPRQHPRWSGQVEHNTYNCTVFATRADGTAPSNNVLKPAALGTTIDVHDRSVTSAGISSPENARAPREHIVRMIRR